MPPIVGALATIIWTTVGTISVAGAVAIASFVVNLAISVAISAISRALQPKPRAMQQGVQLETKLDPAYPREVIVGVGATGGSLAFEDVEGDNNENWWQVIAISDAACDGVESIICSGTVLTFTGDVTTGLRPCTNKFTNNGSKLYVRVYLGSSSQTADADLLAAFPSLLDSNFRGRGITYAIIKRIYDTEAWQGTGEFTFVMRGAPCWDPRLASGAGDYAYTANAALIAGQYLRGFENNGVRILGLGVATADLPDADLEAAADECDESVSLDGGGTEARYRAGGVIGASETPREVLSHLMAAMAGRHVDRGGEIVLLPGVARTPVLDIAESDLLADAGTVVALKRTADERINAIVSTYVSPADFYQEGPLPPISDATAITEDGDTYETTRAYRFVYSYTQGQRINKIELKRARAEGFMAINAPLWAFELTPGDWVTMTSRRWGNVEKTWEVESVNLAISMANGSPVARTALTLRETTSAAYSWVAATDEITVSASGDLVQPGPLPSFTDNLDRIISADGLPIGYASGTGLSRSNDAPLSASSSSQINVAAHTVYILDKSYSLPSASITSLSTDTGYYVFYDIAGDDYVQTSSYSTAVSTYYIDPNAYIPVGYQRTQTGGGGYTPPPPPPPGGGGGSGGGGGGACVDDESWLGGGVQAKHIEPGDVIDVLDVNDFRRIATARVEAVERSIVRCVALRTAGGASVVVSTSTPLTQPNGSTVLAPDALGAVAAVDDGFGGTQWEEIVAVADKGFRRVAHIHVGGKTYAAASGEGARRVFTHNQNKS